MPHVGRASPLSSLSNELQIAESFGYQILNVEDLGEHYQRTLYYWIER